MPVLLGEMLIQKGILSPHQIDEILEYKASNRSRFGEAAVKLGFIDENTLPQMLAEQL